MFPSNPNGFKTIDQLYSVPLISQDLRYDETIVQIADTLQHLNNVISDVFSRVNSRIDANLTRTEKLTDRISVCSDKVKKLTGANKAIQVFSSAKYPSSEIYKNYTTLFECNELTPVIERNDQHLRHNMKKQPNRIFQEKREFFHVKVDQPNNSYNIPAVIHNKGLGQVTKDISTVGNLLVFNSDESLFSIYNDSDVNKGRLYHNQSSTLPEQIGFGALDAAPSSITNRERLIGKDAEHYLYAPDMGEVPELDMPLDLPHLPGIAGDLQYAADIELTIAPSAVTSPSISAHPDVSNEDLLEEIVDLPDVTELPEFAIDKALYSEEKEILTPAPPPPPPPPPPPLPPLPQPLIPSEAAISVSLTETDSNAKDNKKNDIMRSGPMPPKSTAPSMDSHSSLMDAIRKAGGVTRAKLKSTSLKDSSKVQTNSGGGDLMADLHAKLSMRRKGISGDKPQGGGTVLDKISALIPPPPPAAPSNTEHSSNEDDWE